MTDYPKKLIEVALPLEDINAASAREKSIRHGHPSTLHLWWARRPLAAARAVLFAQLVDDPSGYVDELWEDSNLLVQLGKKVGRPVAPHEKDEHFDEILITMERERLFDLIRQLVLWENTNNESVLEPAREEIRISWRRTCRREGKPEDTPMPPFLDPFAGGGAIPLEAQRLGLESHASDLNPVAVLINKAMIEIPPKFANLPPVHPEARKEMGTAGWSGAAGLAEDVRRYGQWMFNEAYDRLRHLYPKFTVTEEVLYSREDITASGYKSGDQLNVIAWVWARTIPSPNPALEKRYVPLISSFFLSTKKERNVWMEPVIEGDEYYFAIKVGKPSSPEDVKSGTKSGRANFKCLLSGAPITPDYIKKAGMNGNLSERLLAIVCEGTARRGREYFTPTKKDSSIANSAPKSWVPGGNIPRKLSGGTCAAYGLDTFGKLYTSRQLYSLNTFCSLIEEVKGIVSKNTQLANEDDHSTSRATNEYAKAMSVYLTFAISRMSEYSSTLCTWASNPQMEIIRGTFARQAIPMTWDFAESNIFGKSTGSAKIIFEWIAKSIVNLPAIGIGKVTQRNAENFELSNATLCTDPPYFDNVNYADLSDYFYVWLRRSLGTSYPSILSTMVVPKEEELVASNHRHGDRKKAEIFFLNGMTRVMHHFVKKGNSYSPVTIYYAFKQSESDNDGTTSRGWATFLQSIIEAGFAINGTWPLRTERSGRMIGIGANALASSIVLVCRKRLPSASMATRREFVQTLQRELPKALRELQQGNIAPVDLPQSSIGPGMAIFSRYSKVLESDGTPLKVKTALQLINSAVDEFLSEQEARMDDWTRFAVTWFSQYGFESGPFGDAQNIANARNVSVDGVRDAGIIKSGGGKVRLLQINELESNWDPKTDKRITVWEVTHHLIKRLEESGESAAAQLLKEVGGLSEDARSLCYRLYTLCEQKKWTDKARAYNGLITLWPQIGKLATTLETSQTLTQDQLGI